MPTLKQIEIYKFEELPSEVQDKLIKEYITDTDFDLYYYYQEQENTIKEIGKLFNCDISYNYSKCSGFISLILKNENNLRGHALFDYIVNLKYYCKYKQEYKNIIGSDCPCTGVYYDHYVIEIFNRYIEDKKHNKSLQDLLNDASENLLKCFQNELKELQSKEYIRECLINHDYDYSITGVII